MRLLAIALATLVLLLQWPLWFGKGSWLRVWQLDQQLSEQRDHNGELRERNDALEAEVVDLKTGTDAIEERARNELGMIRKDEVFFQVLDRSKPVDTKDDGKGAFDGPTQ
ncbi:cell division protein FtsB [Chitinibacteraceae bacterium HSL-7]